MKISLFWRKMLLVLLSILLLSLGWLGATGLTLLVALVPLLWISSTAEDSRQGWWSTFGWALLTFVGWNLSTIWWIGFATPIGPVAATVASSFYSMLAFMLFHTVSKRAPKALAYTVLVSVWIALEYNYTVSDFSWPWLLLGNGFSNDIWAIQWYEYTGIFGGSLWVLLSNILFFEAFASRSRAKYIATSVAIVAPLVLSLVIFFTYDEGDGERVTATVIQPNVDCYEKFSGEGKAQEDNLVDLLEQVDDSVDLVLMPETAIPTKMWLETVHFSPVFNRFGNTVKEKEIYDTSLIFGISSIVRYKRDKFDDLRVMATPDTFDYEVFNTAYRYSKNDGIDYRHKAKLVIGVENTPSWIFKVFRFFVIDLGGVVGQLGKGDNTRPFDFQGDKKVGTAICYEGLYGDFYGGFVRDSAQVMAIISNDGWWGDTPGHRHLYSLSKVRAVEHRRAIARSANTGVSGFIDARGVSLDEMGWGERGLLTHDLVLNSKLTVYTRWGDYIARIMVFVALLSLLYFVAYRVRRRHHLVE
ncbi:MAG: apolipoprotein N-acyltransferase [Rikenellaceae bacterium]